MAKEADDDHENELGEEALTKAQKKEAIVSEVTLAVEMEREEIEMLDSVFNDTTEELQELLDELVQENRLVLDSGMYKAA